MVIDGRPFSLQCRSFEYQPIRPTPGSVEVLLHSLAQHKRYRLAVRVRTYEGRSINKLQNGVILLVFQIIKIRNIRFVGNLTLISSCKFYDDDVTVTLFINIKYGDVATEIIP